MKFLIIDDNFETTDMLKEFFEKSNFQVKIVHDGKQGLESIKNEKFDKILLDIAMPEFNGIDVVEELSKENFKEFEKIIIITALAMTAAEIEFLSSYGIKKIISKPLKMADLLQTLTN